MKTVQLTIEVTAQRVQMVQHITRIIKELRYIDFNKLTSVNSVQISKQGSNITYVLQQLKLIYIYIYI